MLDQITSVPPSRLNQQYQTNTVSNNNYAYSPEWMFENTQAGKVGDDLELTTTSALTSPQTTQATQTVQTAQVSSECSDGKDDGKIGFFEAAGNFVSGAFKSVVNTVKDIVTDPVKLVKTVATGVVCYLCPPVGVALSVYGLYKGVQNGAKAISNAANATTDAEAKAAFQDMGGSAVQIGVSAAGVKAGLKAMRNTAGSASQKAFETRVKGEGLKGAYKNAKSTAKAYLEDTVTGGRGFQEGTFKINTSNAGYKGTQIYTNVKNNIKTEGGVIKGAVKSAKDGADKIHQSRLDRAAQKDYNKYDKLDDAGKAKIDEKMDVKGAEGKVTEAQAKVDSLTKELEAAKQAGDQTKVLDLEGQLSKASNDLSGAKATLKSANEYSKAYTDAAQRSQQYQQNLESAKTARTEAESKLETAGKNLEDVSARINQAKANGGKVSDTLLQEGKDAIKAYDLAKAGLTEANKGLKAANADMHSISSNGIVSAASKANTAAKGAGYSSSFGTLTAPVAVQVGETNANNSNYLNAMAQGSFSNSSISTPQASGNYNFNHDWMDMTLDTTGYYDFNNSYEDVARYSGRVASEIVNM